MLNESKGEVIMPRWLSNTIETFQSGNMFEALDSYYQASMCQELQDQRDCESLSQEYARFLSCFTHFCDAIIFGEAAHDIYMTGEALSSEIICLSSTQKSLDQTPWLNIERCQQQIANLMQFSNLAQQLHRKPRETPIEVLRNPWHECVSSLALAQPELFAEQDHVPLFGLVAFHTTSQKSKLPILEDFVSGWVVPVDLNILPWIESITEHCKNTATCWVFDSLTTLCYALSNTKFASITLAAPSKNAHQLFVAGRAIGLEQWTHTTQLFAHIQKWRTLPTWEILPKDCELKTLFSQAVPRPTTGDTITVSGSVQTNIEAIFEEFFTARKNSTGDLLPFDSLQTRWLLITDFIHRRTQVSTTTQRLLKTTHLFLSELDCQINTTLALCYRFHHDDWYSPGRLTLRDHPFSSLTQTLALDDLIATIERSNSFKITNIQAQKSLPRVVHMTSHLMDKGHSPSKLLRLFAQFYSKQSFDTALLTSEIDAFNHFTYPCQKRVAPHSIDSATHMLKLLKAQEISYKIAERSISPTQRIHALLTSFQAICPDLVIFHGPEPIHYLLAQLLKKTFHSQIQTILFEHGTFPHSGGFDQLLTSVEDTKQVQAESLQKLSMGCFTVPFHINSRSQWKKRFPEKKDLGIPENLRVATTISNHLGTRLTKDFCRVVSTILINCPTLCYAPIGPYSIEHSNADSLLEIKTRFDPKVRDRVIPLGQKEAPSDLTRCMDLYLNEFPFGSCIGILDAMASGLPIVTKYIPNGPPQGRYGGFFAGLENSCDSDSDYIKRAQLLMNDPMTYYIASQRSYQEYETRSSPDLYIKEIENILFTLLEPSLA